MCDGCSGWPQISVANDMVLNMISKDWEEPARWRQRVKSRENNCSKILSMKEVGKCEKHKVNIQWVKERLVQGESVDVNRKSDWVQNSRQWKVFGIWLYVWWKDNEGKLRRAL